MSNLLQKAIGHYNALAYGEGACAIVKIGLSAAEVTAMLQATVETATKEAQAHITTLASQLSTNRDVVVTFLRTLQAEEVPAEQLPAKLEEIASRYISMMQRLAVLDPENAAARAFIEHAQTILCTASSPYDYDRADDLLRQAEELQELETGDALERELRGANRQRHCNKAATRTERAQLSLTQLKYLEAAEHYRIAATILLPEDSATKRQLLFRSADALESYGDERVDNAILAQAIARFKESLEEIPREAFPLDWSIFQMGLGEALLTLGCRTLSKEVLEECVLVCRSALEELSRIQFPMKWVAMKNSWSAVSWESGTCDVLTNSADKSIREMAVLLGIQSQTTLGSAVRALALWEGNGARLKEVVSINRLAEQATSRTEWPLQSARTQLQLGNALSALGFEESNVPLLKEAIAAYQNALLELTYQRAPMQWATAQNNLGNTLWMLNVLDINAASLQEAIEAFYAALRIWTRERVPEDWALVQANLSVALLRLGEAESDNARIEEAVSVCRNALEEIDVERQPRRWAATQDSLGTALLCLGKREDGIERLKEARFATAAAWKILKEAGVQPFCAAFEKRISHIDELIVSRINILGN